MWTILLTVWAWVRGAVTPTVTAGASTASGTDTEFTAEVVRITEVLPHPNADRLEILRFELRESGPSAYEVVSQKGTFTVGALAAWFSVDCVLPTSHPEFAFLKERLDGAGKEFYRIRAARLRGVFSQGLLVPAPDTHAFGDRVDETFGVTYHRAPEPGTPTAPSGKAQRVQPCPIYGVESLKKVPRLFDPGEQVLVTEKIHGCNFRFGWVRRKLLGIPFGWKFVVGSHRVMKGDGSSGFYGEDLWLAAARKMDLATKTKDYKGFVFYGELYGYTPGGKAIQDLTYGVPSGETRLAVFDVLNVKTGWLGPMSRLVALVSCDLPEVPVLYHGAYEPALLGMAEGKSTLDGKTQREGVVIESFDGKRRKAKFVGEGYLMRKGA